MPITDAGELIDKCDEWFGIYPLLFFHSGCWTTARTRAFCGTRRTRRKVLRCSLTLAFMASPGSFGRSDHGTQRLRCARWRRGFARSEVIKRSTATPSRCQPAQIACCDRACITLNGFRAADA